MVTSIKQDHRVQTKQWIQLFYLKMPLELRTVTAFSFYKSNGAGSAPILLIIAKWGFCHRVRKGKGY